MYPQMVYHADVRAREKELAAERQMGGSCSPLGRMISGVIRKCNGRKGRVRYDERMDDYAMAYAPAQDMLRAPKCAHRHLGLHARQLQRHPAGAAASAHAVPLHGRPSSRRTQAQEEEEEARPVHAIRAGARRRAAAAAARAASCGDSGEQRRSCRRQHGQRRLPQRRGRAALLIIPCPAAGTRRAWQPRVRLRLRVRPVRAVAAAAVGDAGHAAAARVLLQRVPVVLPDAGARGHLQLRHRRQRPAQQLLQRGEPQRVHHRVNIRWSGHHWSDSDQRIK